MHEKTLTFLYYWKPDKISCNVPSRKKRSTKQVENGGTVLKTYQRIHFLSYIDAFTMSKSTESMLMLVYGTLKQGFGADLGTWSDKNRKIKDVWLEGWDMFKSGYPMCIPGTGKILAELWLVDKKCLPDLDRYEGHPNLFKRIEVKVDDEITASMYMYNNPISTWAKPVESGVF